jgi:uncharacterized protein
MRVVVTGSTGLIGTPLVEQLRRDGHAVTRLVRHEPSADDEARWDPGAGSLDPAVFRGADAVVHLAAESIESHRWNAAQKERIRASRVDGTRMVAEALAGAEDGPGVLVCASGTNYYAERGDEPLTEESPPGDDFMADVVVEWEAAADPAREAGLRVCHLRTGLVLDPRGGALGKMLPFARFGLFGRLGGGRTWWSWVSREDTIGAYLHALTNEDVAGPVNVTAPGQVRQIEFARTLNKVLGHPTFPIPAPKFGPWILYGEMASVLAFTSMRVLPERLQETGYTFAYPTLEPALRTALNR